MLADNILFLKEEYPDVYRAVKACEETENVPAILVGTAKDGNPTLKYVKGEQTVYLHSKYNPIREAETIIDKLTDDKKIERDSHIVFFGVGLGYHIEVFAQRFPEAYISIIEPSSEVLNLFFNRVSLKKINYKRVVYIQCGDNFDDFYKNILERRDKSIVISELSVYKQIFKEMYDKFFERFKLVVKELRQNFNVNFAFKRRWVVNSVNNFKYVIKTPNILIEHKNLFKGKTAILVSAGPSLNYEIENLREIKNRGLAYIFTVGSAINTMVYNNIYPDAMCTYDPLAENQFVFKQVNERGINTIPMIFGSSVGYETLEQYPGPKYHMITSQDTVSDYFLKLRSNESIEIVNDAPSIAVMTLEMMIKLGFSQIILVGQNLAYLKDRYYADGVFYDEEKSKNTVMIEDVHNRLVETSEALINMKNNLESIIKKYSANVINTTIGGAKIEGTEFKELSYLLDVYLKDKIVAGTEFEEIICSDIYDKEYIYQRFERLKNSHKRYNELIIEIKSFLRQLHELLKINKEKQLKQTHVKMDNKIRDLEDNEFFKHFGLKMNRVEYKLLANSIWMLKNEKNELKKVKKLIKPTENFIDLLFVDTPFNEQLISVLNNIINDLIE